MVAPLMYLKQPKFLYFCTYLLLANLAVAEVRGKNFGKFKEIHLSILQDETKTQAMASETTEVAALGRPLFLGTLYNCHEDSFIPGVTLWDKKSLNEDLASYPKPHTYSKLSSSDSLSSKFKLLDVSASLKASFLAGLVRVEGSANYLLHTKSSNQQSRVTMFYSETTSYEQLTMTQLGSITYPQVFDQKTATHVVTAVLYGAQAFMVFDWTLSEDEKEEQMEGKLNFMVNEFSELSIKGDSSVNMTDTEKEMAKKITYMFHGDFILDQNPTTFMQAMQIYNQLPALLKKNPQRVVPIKVWLYPLHLLNNTAAQPEREISTSLLINTEHIMEKLGEAERTFNDLSGNRLVKRFRDIKERLRSFQDSFNLYKAMLLKAVGTVLPRIRGGEMEENCMKDILKIHDSSPFNADMLKQWLYDAKSELDILSSYKKALHRINIENSDNVNGIFLYLDIDAVVSLTFTSLEYEDPYLSTLKEFVKFDRFKELDKNNTLSVKSGRKWFSDRNVIIKMGENLSKFMRFAEDNKDEKKIRFIISAISNPNIAGSSIYLYKKWNLIDTQFQPVSKPPPPIVKNVQYQSVSLKLQTSSSTEPVRYRVEYKKVKQNSGAEEPWLCKDTAHKDFTLTGLESGNWYLFRCRIVGKVGVSEASDTVNSFVGTEIVGGTGGDEFSFKSTFVNTFQKIIITYNEEVEEEGFFWSSYRTTSLNTIQVIFQDYQMIQVGKVKGSGEKEFNFDDTDKIVAAKLWPNRYNNRLGGLEFLVEKVNGEKITMSLKCHQTGIPVTVNVKSGRCYGVTGRSGDEIDALGFYFN